jgi:F-type H+-transporting ATPase subunit b
MRPFLAITTFALLTLLALPATAKETEAQQARESLRESANEAVDAALAEQGDAHGPDHADHGDGHHAVDTNPLTTDPDLAIYTAIVFLILFFVLAKFAWKPIAEGLDRRERSISDQIEAANRTHQEAQNLLAQYEQRLARAQDEVREMIEEARRDATHTSQEILAKANAEGVAIKDRALRDIEIAKGAALDELARTSGQIAIDLAGRILRSELDPTRHQHLIQEALERMPAGNGHGR